MRELLRIRVSEFSFLCVSLCVLRFVVFFFSCCFVEKVAD